MADFVQLPDGSGFGIMTYPLSKDHWIYGEPDRERFVCECDGKRITFEPPPMPFRMGVSDDIRHIAITRNEFAEKISRAGRYAVRSSTMKGKEMDFDPDALIQNLVVGMLGYFTANGFTDDEWANPKEK